MTNPIAELTAMPLDIPLENPFTIATGCVNQVTNVVVRVRLRDGAVGWGEAAVLAPVTTHSQKELLARISARGEGLIGRDTQDWRRACADAAMLFKDTPTARAAVQMAITDAAAVSAGVPLWRLFGTELATVSTDITIPICSPDLASRLAEQYRLDGFAVVKTKIGQNLEDDVRRIAAIHSAHPDAGILLDANEGFTSAEAISALRRLEEVGVHPILFEQPVHRGDRVGMARLTRDAGVPIAADESCRSLSDATAIRDQRLANVINIKLAKIGLIEALEIIALARFAGLGLMFGAMVESRIGCGFAAHLVAGSGGFDHVDLDTALLMAADPVVGGVSMDGPRFVLSPDRPGHGIVGVKGIPS